MNLEKIPLILFLKPYSNWNTFNTICDSKDRELGLCFKPYSNWTAFNTS